MKPARRPPALARFDGMERTLGPELRVVPSTQAGQLALELPGEPARGPHRLAFVLGHGSLEQYLAEFPGGKLQALPVGFDPRRDDWFDIFAGEARRPSQWGHWTNRGMTANSQCLFCHTTGYEKGYDGTGDRYASRWHEVGVGCEGCHGPGAGHPGPGDPYARPASDDSSAARVTRRLESCAPCHSRRSEISTTYEPGRSFLDHFDPQLLDTEVYYPDGQIREETYEWGSFVQSRMFQKGVTCVDCHDPHSGRLARSGDTLCLSCHRPELATAEHTHHATESAGARCVGCHMRETVYMQRDPRRDHSFALPDPRLTMELGIPNACNACHAGETAAWAAARVDAWYPSDRRAARRNRARTFAHGRERDPRALPKLRRLARGAPTAITRASAARLLAPFATSPDVRDVLAQSARDPEPLVRAAALDALGRDATNGGAGRGTLVDGCDDPTRLVRIKAGFGLRSDTAPAPAVRAARDEWEASALAMSERPESQYNLGVYYADQGDAERAIAAYRSAIRFDAEVLVARHNLAMVLATEGRDGEAESEFRAILDAFPEAPHSAFSLGLFYGEHERWTDAIGAFERAIKDAPTYPRAHYNLGLALAKAGRLEEALPVLARATTIPGARRSAATVLASLYDQRGESADAARWQGVAATLPQE